MDAGEEREQDAEALCTESSCTLLFIMYPLVYKEWGDLFNTRLVIPSSQPLDTTGSANRSHHPV